MDKKKVGDFITDEPLSERDKEAIVREYEERQELVGQYRVEVVKANSKHDYKRG